MPRKFGEPLIRKSLNEQLVAKKMDAAVYRDMVDKYIGYWRTAKALQDDIDKYGVRITSTSGSGVTCEKLNESVRELPKIVNAMLSILKSLGLQEPTVPEANDGSDYM